MDEVRLVLEVAADDLLALGVLAEPALAVAQQFLHLVLADPVVLVVVEHRHEDVEVGQQVGERTSRAVSGELAAVAPVGELRVERDRRDLDAVAQRLEEPAHERLAAARGHGGSSATSGIGDAASSRGPCTSRPRARTRHDRDAQERRRDVRPVVDVLGEREPLAAAPAAHEPDRVDVEQQRGRAALVAGLRVEDVRRPNDRSNDCTRSGCLCSR